MDRETYIRELRKELKRYSQEEVDSAVEYVNEYYDEAEDNSRVIRELGTPRKFAAQIKADRVVGRGGNGSANATSKSADDNGGIKTLIIVLLGLLSLPVSVPLIVMVFIIMFAILIAAFAVIVSLVAVGLAAPITSVVLIGTGIGLLGVEAAAGGLMIGFGLIGIGVSIFVILIMYWVIKYTIRGVTSLLSYLYNKIRGRR